MALLWSRRFPVGLYACAMMLIVCSVAYASGLTGTPYAAETSGYGGRTRWAAVMSRFAQEQSDHAWQCTATADPSQCPAARWSRLVAELSGLPLRERVERVNAELNRVPYISAEQNWGDPGYWETPYEFLSKGGQCQDYAIAKFLALVQSGVPESALRFVVVHDSVSQLDHAITIVDVDGDELVLDNQVTDVASAADDDRYTPYYALNDSSLWVYTRPVERVDRVAAQIALRPGGGFTVARY